MKQQAWAATAAAPASTRTSRSGRRVPPREGEVRSGGRRSAGGDPPRRRADANTSFSSALAWWRVRAGDDVSSGKTG